MGFFKSLFGSIGDALHGDFGNASKRWQDFAQGDNLLGIDFVNDDKTYSSTTGNIQHLNSVAVKGNSALDFNAMNNMKPDEIYSYLAKNDPANATAWTEAFANQKINGVGGQMAQLKEAGINPLLAVTGGVNGAPAIGDTAQSSASLIGNQRTNDTSLIRGVLAGAVAIGSAYLMMKRGAPQIIKNFFR